MIAKGIPEKPEEIKSYFLLSDTLIIDTLAVSLPIFAHGGLDVFPYNDVLDSQKFVIAPFNEYYYVENGKKERMYITCNVHSKIISIKR